MKMLEAEESCDDGLQHLIGWWGQAPSLEVLREGTALFRKRNGRFLEKKPFVRAVVPLAKWLYLKKWEAEAKQDEMGEPPAKEREKYPDAESVAEAFEGVVRHAGRMILFSRWLRVLRDATIFWDGVDGEGERVLCLESGEVIESGSSKVYDRLLPGRPGKPRFFWRKGIDIATWDRLRVLTTEIRRLLSAGRKIRLKTIHGVVLGNGELERVLRWV
jgi:hypothetical protein